MSNCPHCHRPLNDSNSYRKGPYRAQEGQKLLGVCAGVADYFGWSRVWVRVATVVLCFVAFPATLFVYFIAGLIMEPAPYTDAEYRHVHE